LGEAAQGFGTETAAAAALCGTMLTRCLLSPWQTPVVLGIGSVPESFRLCVVLAERLSSEQAFPKSTARFPSHSGCLFGTAPTLDLEEACIHPTVGQL
jgi:hypothetical protein